MIDKKQMTNFLLSFTNQFDNRKEIIVLDGKRIRGGDVHLLHVFAAKKGIILAQKYIENKVN